MISFRSIIIYIQLVVVVFINWFNRLLFNISADVYSKKNIYLRCKGKYKTVQKNLFVKKTTLQKHFFFTNNTTKT